MVLEDWPMASMNRRSDGSLGCDHQAFLPFSHLHLGSEFCLSPMAHSAVPGPLPMFVYVCVSPSNIPAQLIHGGIWSQETLSDTVVELGELTLLTVRMWARLFENTSSLICGSSLQHWEQDNTFQA